MGFSFEGLMVSKVLPSVPFTHLPSMYRPSGCSYVMLGVSILAVNDMMANACIDRKKPVGSRGYHRQARVVKTVQERGKRCWRSTEGDDLYLKSLSAGKSALERISSTSGSLSYGPSQLVRVRSADNRSNGSQVQWHFFP